ncbi:MAG: ImmA/IrrE family metallo-endopeptidase, partial [Monoglobus pectinilyticus]
FYNITSTFETMGRQEERAKRWAVENVITYDKLNEAIKKGIREIWELADYFNVTEDFIRDAVGVFKLQGYEI